MTYPIRPISEEEWPQFSGVLAEGFNWTPHPTQTERWKANTEFDRTLAAFDGDLIAGVTGIHTFSMAVPGGMLPVAGVTAVSVLPSHRRRGILSQIMRRQLADIRERGEAVAALYASEAIIYGRFGYGRAADSLALRIPTHRSAFTAAAPSDPSLRVRVVRPADVRPVLEELFAEVVARRPGRYARDEGFWNMILADEEFDQQGAGSLRAILVEDSSRARGYALFRVKGNWGEYGAPDGELQLRELHATDPAAHALLWRAVLDRDLVTKVTADIPVDDPITQLLADVRQLHPRWLDDLWVRLVSVDAALTSRAYSAPVDVVIEVADDVCPWNAGRWRLTADTGSAACKRTDEAPDVSLPVSALGGAYMGAGSLVAQRSAGLLTEHSAGAVHALATAMSWSPAPWAGWVF
ncbi:GNAT family N-acetyltransferase [Nonomuraea sp. NPDC059194]|uniref:GNAT family N-acetyltransferase n=1 Tax=Nonomuraea sp. NPDC059194 TaxID=3346764 RepID=UPI0036880B16